MYGRARARPHPAPPPPALPPFHTRRPAQTPNNHVQSRAPTHPRNNEAQFAGAFAPRGATWTLAVPAGNAGALDRQAGVWDGGVGMRVG